MRSSVLCFPKQTLVLISILCAITIQSMAQTKSSGNLPQYLFPGFTKGLVKMKAGKNYDAVLNYNMVTENMVMEKDGTLLDLTNMAAVDTIILQYRRFVPFNEVFYEVLVNNSISFFIQHKCDLVSAGSPSGYGSTSQTSAIKNYSSVSTNSRIYNLEIPADYTLNPSPVYWIRKGNTMFSFLNKRQFLKIFPEKNKEIEKFINQNRLKIENLNDLIILGNYCNKVYK